METTNKKVIWGWGIGAGVLAFVILMFVMGYGPGAALILGVLIAILVAILIWIGFYRDEEDEGLSGAEVEAPRAVVEPAPAAAPKAGAAQAQARRDVGMMGEAGQAMKASVAAVADQPVGMAAARAGGADDLKRIKGIGPKLETLLNSMGYFHFDQIASWTEKEAAWVDNNLKGFKGRVSRDNWVAQAQVLAAGGETEFSEKVDQGDVY